MKYFIALFLAAFLSCLPAYAEDPPGSYWMVVTNHPLPDKFNSADAACKAFYNYEVSRFNQGGFGMAPYNSPSSAVDPNAPKAVTEACNQTVLFQGKPYGSENALLRRGGGCENGQTYNPYSGECEDPNEDQAHNELGESDSPQATGGVLICKGVGDPINASMGNVFESEIDYQDSDGELRFIRYYNSSSGSWTHTYQASIYTIDSSTLVIMFDDGHSSLFTLNNGVATAEPSELGSMNQVNGQWVYTSAANEQFVFDSSGRLITWRQANGLAQTLTYATSVKGGVVIVTTTVTDSRGHVLIYNTSLNNGLLAQLATGDLTVAYTWNTATDGSTTSPQNIYQLTTVAATRASHTGTRTYTYGDTRNPKWLTSLTDERGIAYASWAYDAQGRATSSQHAGGADATTVTYNSDGTSTVSNALGHNVTYTYQVIQGVNRITHIAGEPAASCPASNSSYTYTANGQVQTMTDALGHVTAYTYDTLGREITRVEAQGTPQARTITTQWNTTWPYLRDTVTTADHTTTYNYDSQGRLLSTTQHDTKE